MKVFFTPRTTICTVEKEPGDKKIRTESQFFYELKKALKKNGYDVIKKLMSKDGHLVSEGIYYIRERKGDWAIYDCDYQIRNTVEEYEKHGWIYLCHVFTKDK